MIVNLVFSHLGFWSGNLFLIAAFPDRCLLAPFPTMYLLPKLHKRPYKAIFSANSSYCVQPLNFLNYYDPFFIL